MRNKKLAEKLLSSYNSQVAWAGTDEGHALQSSINFVFSTRTDEERANLYSMLMEGWKEYQAGISRKLFVANAITKWNHSIVYDNPARVVPYPESSDGE